MARKLSVVFAAVVLSITISCSGKSSIWVSASSTLYFKDPISSIEMVYVKGGCYQMGDILNDPEGREEEKPVHEVCVNDFYLGKYEVTQGQWENIMENNPAIDRNCGEDCPVDNISWNDVQNYISKLNRKSGGSKYRLPTEAEWEYAARSGGKREQYAGGNDVGSVAWYNENAREKNHPVGTKAPNGLGIHDMSGSVWEWTNDWYENGYYTKSPRNNPTGPDFGIDRVVRGGCRTGEAFNMRTARRNGFPPDVRRPSLGFRLLRTM